MSGGPCIAKPAEATGDAARPVAREDRRLLAGKVIGIGQLGLTLIAGIAAVLIAGGAFNAPARLGGSVALVIPW